MLWDHISPAFTMSTPEADRISLDSDICSPFLLNSFNDDFRLETSLIPWSVFPFAFTVSHAGDSVALENVWYDPVFVEE
ncbi:hypothetical protein H671_3g10105 [Cricetulus griseus]|uniref:Uncharacterized protein n=1 Tax=Cricetulus griseus TaxID=10029 RepID=A0A061IBX9_CRIGR|nr:hypothetical protein H671_3g10105 [Cricetulus griseus]